MYPLETSAVLQKAGDEKKCRNTSFNFKYPKEVEYIIIVGRMPNMGRTA